MGGAWMIYDDYERNLGSTLTVDNTKMVEGAGCLHIFVSRATWNNWVIKRNRPTSWDLRANPVLRFRIFPVGNVNVPISLGLVTGEPDGWGWNPRSYGVLKGLVPNQWNEVSVDLRVDSSGMVVPDSALQWAQEVSFNAAVAYQTDYEYYLDFFEVEPGVPINVGQLAITSYVNRVSNPILVEIVEKNQTFVCYGSATVSLEAGTYTVNGYFARQKFTKTVTIVAGQTYNVTFDFAYVPSVKKIHTQGRLTLDSDGKSIILAGINQTGFWDDPAGWWTNYNAWEPSEIRRHLKVMKAYGMNAVRLIICAGWWIQDNVTFLGKTYSYRQSILQTVQMAQEEGLYVIVTGYSILPINDPLTRHPPIPFPPYLLAEEQAIIPTEQAFIDYCVSVVDTLKNYPNVLFELWNEPANWGGAGVTGDPSEVDAWFRVAQQAINAIRQISDTPIIFQWGYCEVGSFLLDWTLNRPLTGSNIIYSTHIYRQGWTLGNPNTAPYDYNGVKTGLDAIRSVARDQNKPMFIGEVGALDGDAQEAEYYKNTLKILNEWQIGYTSWCWRPDVSWRHTTSRTSLDPTSNGKILIAYLMNVSPPITHTLTVNSNLVGVPFDVDGTKYLTPWTGSLLEGSHVIAMPSNVLVGPDTYNFKEWEDASTNPVRTITLSSNMTITATYELVTPPTAKAYIQVHAFLDATEIVADGVIVETGQPFKTPTVPPIEVNPGTYNVEVTYQIKQTKTVSVAENQTLRLDFQFAIPKPLLQKIKEWWDALSPSQKVAVSLSIGGAFILPFLIKRK